MEFSRSDYSSLPTKSGVYVYLDTDDTVLYVGKAKDLKARVSSYFVNKSLLGTKTRVLVSQIAKIRITIVESEVEALLLEAYYIKKYNPRYNIRLTDNKSYVRIRITDYKNTVIARNIATRQSHSTQIPSLSNGENEADNFHAPTVAELKKSQPKNTFRGNDKYKSTGSAYPRVLLARREDDPASLYFGPYPSSGAVKMVLKIIRRIFPFQSVPNHPKQICLYNHLGLCPCPAVFDSPELQKEYKKNIRGIIRILEGESKNVMKDLEKERDAASKNEDFEKALQIQRKINALSIITTPFHKPFEYDVNPNLRSDIRDDELNGLKEVLNQYGYEIQDLHRIECYDNSNFQGTNATSSMVVFIDGEKESSQYRKFKVRRYYESTAQPSLSKGARGISGKAASNSTPLLKGDLEEEGDFSKAETYSPSPFKGEGLDEGNYSQEIDLAAIQQKRIQSRPQKEKPNDFAMMKEVLMRRFKHDEWETPDLIIVDGGKGQVSAGIEALAESGLNIPLVGLAKREETIVIPTLPTENYTSIFPERAERVEGLPGKPSTSSGKNNNAANLPIIRNYQELLSRRFAGLDSEKDKTIVVNEDNFTEVSFPKNSPSRHLIMRIRDEAHRFAINYHRKLRSKAVYDGK